MKKKNSIDLNELLRKVRRVPNPPPRTFKDKSKYRRKKKYPESPESGS